MANPTRCHECDVHLVCFYPDKAWSCVNERCPSHSKWFEREEATDTSRAVVAAADQAAAVLRLTGELRTIAAIIEPTLKRHGIEVSTVAEGVAAALGRVAQHEYRAPPTSTAETAVEHAEVHVSKSSWQPDVHLEMDVPLKEPPPITVTASPEVVIAALLSLVGGRAAFTERELACQAAPSRVARRRSSAQALDGVRHISPFIQEAIGSGGLVTRRR